MDVESQDKFAEQIHQALMEAGLAEESDVLISFVVVAEIQDMSSAGLVQMTNANLPDWTRIGILQTAASMDRVDE